MSVEDSNVIDLIGINEVGEVILTISDHLEWPEEIENHHFLIQEKINSYLAFVEGGEINESYPNAVGKDIKIRLICKFHPNGLAIEFLSKICEVIKNAGFLFEWEVFGSGRN
ncbi:DUF6572 domain-containing protein [Chitinivorax sp. B]|uniref:DUF6572 domain-containing protein n=1 Tax=Chitinivorax sp. B TaxID=2502235 RepID=UPI0010F92C4F|nr:DUF6572 domain-containing protein [Chitinivorax sp. B]